LPVDLSHLLECHVNVAAFLTGAIFGAWACFVGGAIVLRGLVREPR